MISKSGSCGVQRALWSLRSSYKRRDLHSRQLCCLQRNRDDDHIPEQCHRRHYYRLQSKRALSIRPTCPAQMPEKTVLDAEELLASLPSPWPHDPWLEIKDLVKQVGKVVVVLDDDPTGTQTVHDVPLLTTWSQQILQEELQKFQHIFTRDGGEGTEVTEEQGKKIFSGTSRYQYPYPVLYLLTNARAMRPARAEALYRSISANIAAASAATGVEVVLVSRSDSTLRGHFPLDLRAISQGITDFNSSKGLSPAAGGPGPPALPGHFDGWIVMPFFEAAGRLTVNNVHYVMVEPSTSGVDGHGIRSGGGDASPLLRGPGPQLVPAAMTEFASDKAFGFSRSNLRAWVEEKTHGEIPKKAVRTITLKDLRRGGPEYVRDSLMTVTKEEVVVVDAVCQRDLDVFVAGLLHAELCGKNFLFRTAASFVKERGGVESQPLLQKADLIAMTNSEGDMEEEEDKTGKPARKRGGLVIFGSYVSKSTGQLEAALKETDALAVEVQLSDKVLGFGPEASNLSEEELAAVRVKYVKRLTDRVEHALTDGRDVVMYTSRAVRQDDGHGGLSIGAQVSELLVSIVKRLTVRPSFLIAKGGITSNDIATKALKIQKALVAGQILPGVPVWSTDEDCKYPGLPYVVFPGNVGGITAVAEAMHKLGSPKKGSKRSATTSTTTTTASAGAHKSPTGGNGGAAMQGHISGGSRPGGSTLRLLKDATIGRVAVGAFNVYNLEGALAVGAASENTGRPAILQVHPAALKFGGVALLYALKSISQRSIQLGHPALAVHLDHATPAEEKYIRQAVEEGLVDSIMVDGSAMDYEENVRWTSGMAKYAHKKGIAVEAELGRLAGEEDGLSIEEVHAKMTDPEEVPDFLKRTSVDFLACTIGNVHGKYAKPPKLDFHRLNKIRASSGKTPLVLHGASGLPRDQVEKAIKLGICKFNVNTEMRQAYMVAVASLMQQQQSSIDVLALMEESKLKMKCIAEQKMRLFGLI